MKNRQLQAVRELEERLKYATPAESAKLTKLLVKIKDDFVNK